MSFRFFLSVFFLVTIAAQAEVVGVGATFPQPIVRAWVEHYRQVHPLVVRYEGSGSAEGIRRISSRAVDFALTDIPLTQSELSKDDLIQWPLVVSGIVPVINLPGISDQSLRLTGDVLSKIYLGEITRWNDPAIQLLNPNLSLPTLAIIPVHREEGSGTSFTFTSYLSSVSPTWDEKYGIGSKLLWPLGPGAKGNDGVVKYVQQAKGAIGYVEFLYAQKYELATVMLKNKSGEFVKPSLETFAAAASKANWCSQNYYQILSNQEGAISWPIVGVSYVLMHRNIAATDEMDTKDMLNFFDWIYRHGQIDAQSLSYLLINQDEVFSRIKESWFGVTDLHGKKIFQGK
jgi:phosphate transport system substrate-binding protein